MPASPGVQTSRRAHNNLVVSKAPAGKAIGASSFAVRTGEGALFAGTRGRVMLVQPAAYNAAIAQPTDRTQCGVFNYASISGDTLSGVAFVSGANVNYSANCYVIDEWSDEDVADIWAAINALEAATTAANPPANTFYADSGGTNAAAFRAVSAGDISGLFAAGANVTVTPAGGVITIAASVTGGGITGAAGRFNIADYGAVAGLASTSANVAANDTAIEAAYQAAVAYTATTGRGASIYVPAGDWLFSRAIWLDQPDMQLVGDGYASVLHQIGNFGTVGPLVVVGHARLQNGEAIPDDTYADAFGVLDTSIAAATYNWFGRRLRSASQPTAQRANYHIAFSNSNLSAFRDYWYSCRQLTVEVAFTMNPSGTTPGGLAIAGAQTDPGLPAPWKITTFGTDQYQFAFTTDELTGTAFRVVNWSPGAGSGLQRLAVTVDLATGTASVIHNNVTQAVTVSTAGAPTPAAFSAGGYSFRRNERGMPFQIGSVSAVVHAKGGLQADVTVHGLWFGDYRKYTFGTVGAAAVQDTSGGDAAATINDAFRYKLGVQNGRQVFYLDGSKYGPAGGTGYAGKPTKPDPQNNRLCPAYMPGLSGTIASMSSFGLFERDFLATAPLAGQGSSQNSNASNVRVAGLTLLPYWGGTSGICPSILVGTGYEPRFERLHIVNGFQGIGFMCLTTNFNNWITDCFIDGCWDCALYLAEGVGKVTDCRMGTIGMSVIKLKGASYDINWTMAATGDLRGRAAIDLFHGNTAIDVKIEGFHFDNEGEFATTEGILRAEAGNGARLELRHFIFGTAHTNAPAIYLAEGGGLGVGANRVTIEGMDISNFGGRAFVVAEGTSWRGKIDGTVPAGKGTSMSMLESCAPDGTSFVAVEDRGLWTAPPNVGLYSKNAGMTESPRKVDGFPYQWDVAGSGGWGASSPSPRAAIAAIGFGGDPAGPPAWRPRASSLVTPTGDELGAIGWPDDSVYAALTPDPTALTPLSKVYAYSDAATQPLKAGPQAQYGRLSLAVRDAMNNYWLRGTAPVLPAGTVQLGRANRGNVGTGNLDTSTAATVGAATYAASSGGAATLAADVTLGVAVTNQLPKYSIAQQDSTRTIFTALLPNFHSPAIGDPAYKLAAGTGLVVARKLPPYAPFSPRGSFLTWAWDAENNAWLNTGGTLASPPTDLYAGLCTIDLRGATVPPLAAAILAAEATGGGYARAHVGLVNFNASSNGITANSAAITFPTLSGPLSAPVLGVFLTDSASGAGTTGPFFFAQLIRPIFTNAGYTGAAGSTPSFAPGAFMINR